MWQTFSTLSFHHQILIHRLCPSQKSSKMIFLILRAYAIIISLLFTSTLAKTKEYRDNNSDCDCYAISSGSETHFLRNHRFHDFRFFSRSSRTFFQSPPVVTDTNSDNAQIQDVLTSRSFQADWSLQDWDKPSGTENPIAMYNSKQNIYVMQSSQADLGSPSEDADTYLVFRTQRQGRFQTSGEMEHRQRNLMYASVRFHARVRGDYGACAGMFLYRDKNTESDIEILTKDNTTTYYYTNQPSTKDGDDIPGAAVVRKDLPPWTEWHTHRLDWMPGITRSYLDGVLVAENRMHVPHKTMWLDINMWSNGGQWTKVMKEGGSAELQIQWIQLVFNTSGSNSRSKRDDLDSSHLNLFGKRADNCKNVCAIDGVQRQGIPEVRSRSGGSKQGVPWTYLLPLSCCLIWLIL